MHRLSQQISSKLEIRLFCSKLDWFTDMFKRVMLLCQYYPVSCEITLLSTSEETLYPVLWRNSAKTPSSIFNNKIWIIGGISIRRPIKRPILRQNRFLLSPHCRTKCKFCLTSGCLSRRGLMHLCRLIVAPCRKIGRRGSPSFLNFKFYFSSIASRWSTHLTDPAVVARHNNAVK